jgi:hypothetical protein
VLEEIRLKNSDTKIAKQDKRRKKKDQELRD